MKNLSRRYEDIVEQDKFDPDAAMLLFDMRNMSSNSTIPASVVETMTDIVLEKMRVSPPGSVIEVTIAPIVEGDAFVENVIGDGVLSANPNDHAVIVLERDIPGLRWHKVDLQEGDDTREKVMRKVEQAIRGVVASHTREEGEGDDQNVQDAVSGAIAENIATFALDNSVPGPGMLFSAVSHSITNKQVIYRESANSLRDSENTSVLMCCENVKLASLNSTPGQVLRIRPMPDRNSLEAEIGGTEVEVPLPIPVTSGPDAVVVVDVAEAVAAAIDEEDRRKETRIF